MTRINPGQEYFINQGPGSLLAMTKGESVRKQLHNGSAP